MKRFLPAFGLLLLLSGCFHEEAPPPAKEPSPPAAEESQSKEEIKKETNGPTEFTWLSNFEVKNLPPDVLAAQVKESWMAKYRSGSKIYMFVYQPNMNTPVTLSGSAQFAGVLMSADDGKTWKKIFKAKSGWNPQGMFLSSGKIYLDVADAKGAGSGEGNLIRLSGSGEENLWTKTGCYYLVPEDYFKNGMNGSNGIAFGNLKKQEMTACAY